jgi:helicase MOV-10
MNIGHLQAAFETFGDGGKYTPASYCDKFSKLLHVEEMQMEVDMAKYKMKKAKLKKPKASAKGKQEYLTLEVPGLAEKRPSLVRGDRLFVRKLAADGTPEKKRYEGYIHHVELNQVFLKFSAR